MIKNPDRTGEYNVSKKHQDLNSTKMTVFIENNITGQIFLLLFQEYGPNYIIGCTFSLLAQETDHKFCVRIFTIIDNHGTKVTQ